MDVAIRHPVARFAQAPIIFQSVQNSVTREVLPVHQADRMKDLQIIVRGGKDLKGQGDAAAKQNAARIVIKIRMSADAILEEKVLKMRME